MQTARTAISILIRHRELKCDGNGRLWSPEAFRSRPVVTLRPVTSRRPAGGSKGAALSDRLTTSSGEPVPLVEMCVPNGRTDTRQMSGIRSGITTYFDCHQVAGWNGVRRYLSTNNIRTTKAVVKQELMIMLSRGLLVFRHGLYAAPSNADQLTNSARASMGRAPGQCKMLPRPTEAQIQRARLADGLGPLRRTVLRSDVVVPLKPVAGAHSPVGDRQSQIGDLRLPRHDWLIDD